MDLSSIFPYLVGLAVLLAFSAFFSGSETAIFSLTRLQIQRLRERGDKAGRAVVRFCEDLRRLLATVLIGNTFVNIAFSSLVGSLFIQLFGSARGVSFAIPFNLLVILIFGEITPKVYAMRNPERFALRTARLLWLISLLFTPAYWALKAIVDLLMPKGMEFNDAMTADELRAAFSSREELEEREREIIRTILELQEMEAHEIMVPRTDMVCAEVGERIGDVLKKAEQHGVSKIPVYRDSLDRICGIFYVKDLPIWRRFDVKGMTIEEFLSVRERLLPERSDTLIRKAHFVPETRKLSELLGDFARLKTHMVILVDEYGGTSGLVTLEDVVEELVGDIVDEYDAYELKERMIRAIGDGRYEVSGRAPIRLINRTLKLRLDEEEADTIAGYVIAALGRIPRRGDSVEVEGARIEVAEVDGRRVERVILTKLGLILSALLPAVLGISLSWGAQADPALPLAAAKAIPFVILALLLMGMMGFYSGTETAFVSANRDKFRAMKEEGDRRAERVLELFGMPESILTMTLIGTNLMNISATEMGVMVAKAFRPEDPSWQSAVTTGVMTPIVLIFSELLPKSIFRAKANEVMLRCHRLIRWSYLAMFPVVKLFACFSSAITSMVGEPEERGEVRDELKMLATLGERERAIRPQQRRMIHSVLDLHDKRVGQVMVPLVEMVSVRKGTPVGRFLDLVAQRPFTRYPVYEGRIDEIIGIVNALDVIYSGKEEGTIDPFIRRNVTFVPALKRVDTFLKEFQHALITTPRHLRNPMAFVVNEYGGVIGLVTIEDLVEEIIGTVRDEREEGELISVEGNRMICDGRVEVEELNSRFEMGIPEGEYETLAGYLISLYDGVPPPGEVIETDRFRFVVLESDGKTVRRAKIINKAGKFVEGAA
ncbi:hypothetical protein DRP77_04750 [Candidatus Poribacteria bacterium]|nr:MAG: hypothetical protein DRP77_04750 [Candidatus Poribacteria bacterium]